MGEQEQTEQATAPALTVRVRRGPSGPTVEVRVQARDVPGPSHYEVWKYEEAPRSQLPEIDGVALQNEQTFKEFLGGLVADREGAVEVACLRPRLMRVRELLHVPSDASEIDAVLDARG